MKLSIEGYRPAVIDEELYLLLEDFRGFRHVFRHSYSFEPDGGFTGCPGSHPEERRLTGLRREAAQWTAGHWPHGRY